MAPKTPKIKLTIEERAGLRQHKIKLKDIAFTDVRELRAALHSTEERAREIRALAQFQTVPSVGPKFAEDLVLLQYYSLDALKDQDGGRLFDQLEKLYGTKIDPCVEDQLRHVIHYANHGDSDKQWWDFTEERKQYRLAHGYPNRPN